MRMKEKMIKKEGEGLEKMNALTEFLFFGDFSLSHITFVGSLQIHLIVRSLH